MLIQNHSITKIIKNHKQHGKLNNIKISNMIIISVIIPQNVLAHLPSLSNKMCN